MYLTTNKQLKKSSNSWNTMVDIRPPKTNNLYQHHCINSVFTIITNYKHYRKNKKREKIKGERVHNVIGQKNKNSIINNKNNQHQLLT